MIIRKKMSFKGTHIVRNCSSDRCKFSIHSHTYKVEIFFKSQGLDNGQMVMDFGLTKGTIKDFIDSFDHAYSMWNKESEEFKKFQKLNSERWIEMPVSPSAEAYSLMFLYVINKIIINTTFNNGEQFPMVSSVRVHETDTGYAEAFLEDLHMFPFKLEDITFSKFIQEEWGFNWFEDLKNKKPFVNPKVVQQVK